MLEALRGERHDYSAEPLNRAVVLLAIPTVLEMVMESLFAIVGIFWVSRLGRDAVAVVGLTESVMTLIYAVAIGISLAAAAIVARRTGENDPEGAAQCAGQVVVLGVTISAGLGLLLGSFAPNILRLMGANASVVALGSDFACLMFGANTTVFMIFVINAVFRGAGSPVLAMRTLWLASGVNVVLAPVLIFGLGPLPAMGVTGAAVATNIGRGIGVLYQLWHLLGPDSSVRVRLHHLRPAKEVLRSIATTAGNGIAQLLISTTSWIALFKILAWFGSAALAGYTIAMRVVTFVMLPAYGLATAAATLVGQNLGANRPDRAQQTIEIAMRFNVLLLFGVGVICAVVAQPLMRAFTADPVVLDHGVRALWIVSLGFPSYAAAACLGAAFNGAGDTWTPTRLNFCCFWLGEIPLAWLLARVLELGALGVFVSVPVAVSACTLWSFVLFRQGHWKRHRV